MSNAPILENLTIPPRASKYDLFRWCDYIELRTLTHIDKSFSRDALVEAISENKDTNVNEDKGRGDISLDDFDTGEKLGDEDKGTDLEDNTEKDDKQTTFAVTCFNLLRWRQEAFGYTWPFTLDEHAKEIKLIKPLTSEHMFYIQLLLSASLAYCPDNRRKELTSKFELISFQIFKKLMPDGSEVHAFGAAAERTRYSGHLFNRLEKLTSDIRGTLDLKLHNFAKNDAGDGGLDLVAWHPLGDERKGLPIALAQCGCTTDGWPNKMLEASPARLGAHLHTLHDWSTYYFMPLDLSNKISEKMEWHALSDFGKSIVIDRLRFMNLAILYSLFDRGITDSILITEATSLSLS